MSTTANWSYTNVATVWPLESEGSEWTGGPVFGQPYQIACTWAGGAQPVSGYNAMEVVNSIDFYHEDRRVKYGDWIARGVETDRLKGDEIKEHTEYDMSPFDEEPDFKSTVTWLSRA